MMIRGPGIQPGQTFTEIGSNADVAPTLLALGGIDAATQTSPPMDGKSLLPWLITTYGGGGGGQRGIVQVPAETATQLELERGRLSVPSTAALAVTPVREAHWVEFYSLGNLMMCGGETCQANRPDPRGNGALDGMRCGAGTKDGHQVDSTKSNTYRALRFVSKTHGDKLYAEFTSVTDW